MNALLYTPEHELVVTAVEVPSPAEDEVLVRVSAAGICGSDVHGVASRSDRRSPPLIMGHELVGEVVEAGGVAGEALLGAAVAVNPQVPCLRCRDCRSGRENVCARRQLIGGTRPGGFAEYVAIPARCAHRLAAAAASDAVLAEPLATCVRAAALAQVVPGHIALVLGVGTIGVLAAQVLRLAGVSRLVVCDTDRGRLQNVAFLADAAVAPDELSAAVEELTQGRGVDVSVDAVGVESARRSSVEHLSRGGTAVWLGMHSHDGSLDGFDVVVREQRIQGAFAYTDPEFAAAVSLLDSGAFKPQVTFRAVPLESAAAAFTDLLEGQPQHHLKTVIEPRDPRGFDIPVEAAALPIGA